MGQTFDIRFARSAGLAAMLEVPENAFRWKGDGLLRIDAHGISISVKRGLLALFGGKRTQRIPTENLRAVYREGDALRVEFQDGETPRVVLPFWADDRETAANIVRLLPTSETVEMEDSTEAARSGRPRADWRMLWTLTAVLAAVLAAIAAGMWTFYPQSDTPVAAPLASVGERAADLDAVGAMPMPDATAALAESPDSPLAQATPPVTAPAAAPQVSNPESAVPDFLEPPPVILPPLPPLPLPHDYVRSGDFVIPIARGTAAHDVAKAELAVFERETIQLESSYRAMRDLLDGNALTPEGLAVKLGDLELRWWDLTFRIFDNDALADPALLDLRTAMLASARLWRSFLAGYSTGLRKRDHVMIATAFDELARAQEMQSRARLFLR